MADGISFAIIGLGNPGPEYVSTRHNAGFRVLSHLAETSAGGPVEKCEFVGKGDDSPRPAIKQINELPWRIGPPQKEESIFRQTPVWRKKGGVLFQRVILGQSDCLLAMPQLYMNRSGAAVGPFLRFFRIPAERLVVVHDELDLVPGVVRIKFGGSTAGHLGLEDLVREIGCGDFFRIRVGVGHPRRERSGVSVGADGEQGAVFEQDVSNWVLGKPCEEEALLLAEAEGRAADAVRCLVLHGLGEAQKRFHSLPPKSMPENEVL